MLNKNKLFNYITLFFAVLTILASIYSIITKTNPILGIILLVITLVFNYISKKINDKNINLTKEDKLMLEKLKSNKRNLEEKNVKKSSSNSR
ncbi:MAG: hypothetical protein RR136_03305 [Clostridia bacterium]